MSRILIEGGAVLSLDPSVGEIDSGAVLIDDDHIVEVGPGLDAAGADRVDATGCVVLPGFVDTHRHTWQTALRAVCADWTLMEYFRGIRQTFSPRYRAEDVYAGNLAGALEALDAGVTTILDFSHCMNSPAHADAAVEGLRDAGGRGIMAYGYFPSGAAEPAFAEHSERVADARRVRSQHFASREGLLGMGIALTETGLLPFDTTKAEVESARELDVLLTAHTGCVWGSMLCMGVDELHAHGLLDPQQVHVHCNALSDGQLDLLADSGAAVSSTPETEMQMGMGHPVLRRWLERGRQPSLGCDVVSSNSGDMFAQMRLGLQFQRAMDNDPLIARGETPEALDLTVRDALRWGTLGGAEALGVDGRIGSLTPGKQADVIVVGSGRMGMGALADPAGLILHAGASDVRDVLVAGSFVKRDGQLTGAGPSRARGLLETSREWLFKQVLEDGQILPDAPPGFIEGLNAMAEQNLAGAR